ncbi:hypothetical protein L1049_019786 [Liquidambar formosana]|uniref:Glycosyl hydrolase family 32 C-terminal domain-containing protein n=1 Tax=Liquidambar formosana TaxID=63359 RepID=A0AAP0X5I3_LIQFO
MDRRSMIVIMVMVVAPVMIAAQSVCPADDFMAEGKWVSGSELDESFPQFTSGNRFSWPDGSITWQRTAYHFQPRENWMNDGTNRLPWKMHVPELKTCISIDDSLQLLQSIPRVVVFDNKTRSHILQWPVEEVERLRLNSTEFNGIKLGPGSNYTLDIGTATDQLDISAEFEIDKEALEENEDEHVNYDCWGGVAERGSFGPFGLLVNTHPTLSELTPIYFHIAKGTGGHPRTFFCADKTRSSKASSVDKEVYGAEVPVLYHENLSMRLLIDHSVVESFAQGGRAVITVRIYPTEAIHEAARLFVFNYATDVSVVASLKIWKMKSLSFEDYKD